MFGVANVQELLHVNVGAKEFAHVPLATRLWVRSIKEKMDIARWTAQLFHDAPLDRGDFDTGRGTAVKSLFDSKYAKTRDLQGIIKAFGTGVTGAGAEWVWTEVTSQFMEEYELDRKVVALFREFGMNAGVVNRTVRKDGTVAKLVAEGAAATADNFGTDEIVYTARKLQEYYLLPTELDEDSAPAALQIGREQIVAAQARALERAILDGDDSVAHMDSDVVAANDARKAWKGLRKKALDNSANGVIITFGSTASKTKLDEMLLAADKFAINPRECVWVMSARAYNQTKAIPEVSTVEKFGPMATILEGALAAFAGIPIVVSEWIRNDLNVSGVYDGVTTNNTVIHLVNKSRFEMGRRRAIQTKIKMDERYEYDRWQLASYQRVAFNGFTQGADELSSVLGVDVSIS
jgi:hypothetical protein